MASFAKALRDFDDGASSEPELVASLESALADPRSDPNVLLAVIDEHQAARPLPEHLVRGLRNRVNHAARAFATGSGEPSEDTRLATRAMRGPARPPADDDASLPDEATVIGPPILPHTLEGRAAQVGHTLNERFYLEALIGQGGMSLVFRAVDRLKEKAESRNPYVAVKVLDVVGPSERDAYMALQREAQKCQTLNHPHIVRVHEFHQDGDMVYMTMEYLSGVPLSRKLKLMGTKGLPTAQSMKYINQMGEALVHAHRHRILHADFKPSNVIITDDDEVKVIDFGIARAFHLPEDSDDSRTRFHVQKLGALTPVYASAEMIENADPDPRDDVYSLACVAYELLTGRHPFARTKATAARDAALTVRRPEGLKNRQWRALRHALAFEREQRTPSVRAFLDELNPPQGAPMTLLWAGLGVAATVFVGLVLWFELAPDVVQPISAPAPTPTETPEVVSPPLQQPVEVAPPGPEPGSTLRDCEHCPQLVVLPAGSTRIGAEGKGLEHVFETPVHTVTFEQPFAIGVSEVTRAEFAAFVEDSGSALGGCRTVESQWQVDTERSWERPGFEQTGEHPVTCVSWLDAQAYLAWLRRRTGENYRLASEAEWEFAARGDGSDTTIWSSRPESVCQRTNVADMTVAQAYPGLTVFPCEDGFPHTAPVASGEANGYGLRGMRGNVFEWTQDCWNPSYHNAPGDGSAREIGDCNKRVLRGGSWFTAPSEQRLTFRNRFDASYRSNTFGFRVVREVPG